MTDPIPFADVVIDVNDALVKAKVAHGFGGAVALAYYVYEPRGTRDIDINIAVPVERVEDVFGALPTAVRWSSHDVDLCQSDGQVRLHYGRVSTDVPVDLFFPQHRFHDVVATAVTLRPFVGEYQIPVIAAAHLAVFKILFNRTHDWADLEAMLEVPSFDPVYVERWLTELLGADDPRIERLAALALSVSSKEQRDARQMPEPPIDWSGFG